MGSSGSFEVGADAAARDPLKEVLRRFFTAGATLIDTAPSYGSAEAVIGDLLAELGLRSRAFLATKIGTTGREAGLAQFERPLQLLKTDKVELLQIHNLKDWRTQFALIKELKQQGRTRYTGLTHYLDSSPRRTSRGSAQAKPDFLQINYSVVSRGAETRIAAGTGAGRGGTGEPCLRGWQAVLAGEGQEAAAVGGRRWVSPRGRRCF